MIFMVKMLEWLYNLLGRRGKTERRIEDRRKGDLGRTNSQGFFEISAKNFEKINDKPPQYGRDFMKPDSFHDLDTITAKERRRQPVGVHDVEFAITKSGKFVPSNRRKPKHMNRK